MLISIGIRLIFAPVKRGRNIVRAGLAFIIVLLVMTCPAAAQQSTPPISPKTMMSRTELTSFFRTLDLDLPLWRAAVSKADPADLNMSYPNGKFMEMSREDFLDDCDYLEQGLPVVLIKPSPSIKAQVMTLGVLERMRGDVQRVIILYALGARTEHPEHQEEEIGRMAKEINAMDTRLISHVAALAEKLDSLIDVETLLP
jgi:hypothetical protein